METAAMASGVRGSVMVVFFQIYYRTDRDRFFHNWNRCTPPKVGFPINSSAVFCSRFGRFEILKKKKLFFLIIKKLGLQAQYQYINLFKISSKYKPFFYLASHLCHTCAKYLFNIKSVQPNSNDPRTY